MDQRMENYVERGTEIWGILAQENTELTKKNPRGIQADPYSKGLNQTKLLSKNQHF